MTQHIDYEVENERRITHLELTGGAAEDCLTVRDYFAAKAMQVYLQATMGGTVYANNISENAYLIADAMLKQREIYDANN